VVIDTQGNMGIGIQDVVAGLQVNKFASSANYEYQYVTAGASAGSNINLFSISNLSGIGFNLSYNSTASPVFVFAKGSSSRYGGGIFYNNTAGQLNFITSSNSGNEGSQANTSTALSIGSDQTSSFSGQIRSQNINPSAANFYDVGTSLNKYANGYFTNVRSDTMFIQNSSLTSTGNDLYLNSGTTSQTIYVRPNGSGSTTGQTTFTPTNTSFQGGLITIDSSGNLLIGSASSSGQITLGGTTTSSAVAIFNNTSAASVGYNEIHYGRGSKTSGSDFQSHFFGSDITITNAGTLDCYNMALYGPTRNGSSVGTIANAITLYVGAPVSGGTSNVAIQSTNLVVGTSGVTPPAGGAIIMGKLGVAVNNPVYDLQLGSTTNSNPRILRVETNGASANHVPALSLFCGTVAEQVIAVDQSSGNLLFAVNPANYTNTNLDAVAAIKITSAQTVLMKNVGIGTSPNAALILDVASSTKAFAPPRTTTSSITSPPDGSIIYNTTNLAFSGRNNGFWSDFLQGGVQVYVNEQNTGTAGPTAATATWTTATINTALTGNLDPTYTTCPVGTNQITIQPGKYFVSATSCGYRVGRCRLRLRTTTGPSVIYYGDSCYGSDSSTDGAGKTTLQVYIAPTVATSYALDLYVQFNTAAGRGFGVESNIAGVKEYYNPITIIKIA
jgi:hypothetical protein